MSNVIIDLFDLRQDQAEPEVIDEAIRTNVKVAGTNLWVLIFAILVASVGLNVNSTAVIIGAMLISPLMGPIVGMGYGVGINDIQLIRLALRNIAIFTSISLLASTLYFIISPLDSVQSELLARTSPTVWDVLIAFFGGAAGIIATTRKSMSNVVPGVAIATALMPPLCTAGFGIAHGNWSFFFGAFFLYSINSVFIALATLMFVKIFHLPVRHYLDEKTEKKAHMFIGVIVMVMIIPSVYLAWNLVKQNHFTKTVQQYIKNTYEDNNYVLLGHEVHPQLQEVIVTVGGSNNPEELKNNFENRLKNQGFDKAHVTVRYSGTSQLDIGSLKTELTQDLYNNMVKQVEELSKENQELASKLNLSIQKSAEDKQLFSEITAQYPLVTSISISRGDKFSIKSRVLTADTPNTSASISYNHISNNSDNSANSNTTSTTELLDIINVRIESINPLAESDKQRIIDWLTVKYDGQMVEVRFEVQN